MNEPNISIQNNNITDDTWNSLVSHPLQSTYWSSFRSKMGIHVVKRVDYLENKPVACWQLTFHKIPYTPFTIGYFPKGILPTTKHIEELKKIAKQNKAIFIQLEPNIKETDIDKSYFYNLGLKKSNHPLFTKYTYIVDLTKSENELLKNMHHKTRYNIKIANKYGVIVTEDLSQKSWEKYIELSMLTQSRQAFYAHSKKYHEILWETLKNSGILKLFTATYQKETLSAFLLFCFNDTVYYPYGASSRVRREVMAPTLTVWEIIKWAKKNKYKYFDLWGAMSNNPNPKDPWYGFHRFKEGFGPIHITYVGSYDLVTNRPLYYIFNFLNNIRWIFLKITKR